MKEPHIEGVATHDDPESCADAREAGGEALTGARAGWVLSREIRTVRGADAVIRGGRQHDRARYRESSGGPARSQTPSTCGTSRARTGRSPGRPPQMVRRAASGRPKAVTPMMHDQGKSDRPVVPTKPPNNAGRPAAEAVEGRGLAKGNTDEQNAPRTQRRASAPSALDRVREAATKGQGRRVHRAPPPRRRRPPAHGVPTRSKRRRARRASTA